MLRYWIEEFLIRYAVCTVVFLTAAYKFILVAFILVAPHTE